MFTSSAKRKNNVVHPFNPSVIISLCSGMLGIERGLERAFSRLGWKHPSVAAYVEIEAFVIENLLRLMEKGMVGPAPVFSDVKTFPAKYFRQKVHGITSGYPCQPFSHAGERKGADDERHLFPHILGIIQAVNPLWCFFENVPGHISLGYDEVYRSLRDLGYRVESGIFSAAEAGATHERERLFILVFSNSALEGIRRLSECEQGQIRSFTKQSIDINGCGETMEHSNSRHGWESATGRLDMEQNPFSETGRNQSTDGIGPPDKEVGNANTIGPDRDGQCAQRDGIGKADAITPADKTMGHTEPGRCQQRNPGERNDKITNKGCANMGNANSSGFGQSCGSKPVGTQQPSVKRYGSEAFPAPPGAYQHPWESPRVIPAMGCRVNGYNFREDLLRMLGNGVVEQTSEIAFITLLEKHLKAA